MRLDFEEAMAAKSVKKRNKRIEEELYLVNWEDHIGHEHFEHGGTPTEAGPYDIDIQDEEDGSIIISVEVDFYEMLLTGCEPLRYPGSASFEIRFSPDNCWEAEIVAVEPTYDSPDGDYL